MKMTNVVSIAALAGRPVMSLDGRRMGRVVDAVVRHPGAPYPAVAGWVVRVGRCDVWLPASGVAAVDATGVRMCAPRIDVREFRPRADEVLLVRDVLDHQLLDLEGVQMVRANDLYLSTVSADVRLVGVEVGMRSLARRLAPARARGAATPDRMIDWATVRSFESGGLQLHSPRGEVQRLRAPDVARLLDELAVS